MDILNFNASAAGKTIPSDLLESRSSRKLIRHSSFNHSCPFRRHPSPFNHSLPSPRNLTNTITSSPPGVGPPHPRERNAYVRVLVFDQSSLPTALPYPQYFSSRNGSFVRRFLSRTTPFSWGPRRCGAWPVGRDTECLPLPESWRRLGTPACRTSACIPKFHPSAGRARSGAACCTPPPRAAAQGFGTPLDKPTSQWDAAPALAVSNSWSE